MCSSFVFTIHNSARLDNNTLMCTLLDDSSVHITWNNPTNILRDSFTYTIYVTLVSTGKRVANKTVPAAIGDVPSVTFDLHQYTCEEVELSVYIFNTNKSISQVVTVPACRLLSNTYRNKISK